MKSCTIRPAGPPTSTTKPKRWAQPSDWAQYREIITRVYIEENKPLPVLQKMMADKYKFYASAKMYKSRFSLWGLRKNLAPGESARLAQEHTNSIVQARLRSSKIKHAASSSSRSGGGALLPKDSQVAKNYSGWNTYYYEPTSRTTIILPPLTSCRRPSSESSSSSSSSRPPWSPPMSHLWSLSSPSHLRSAEDCMILMSNWESTAFSNGIFVRNPDRYINGHDILGHWHNTAARRDRALSTCSTSSSRGAQQPRPPPSALKMWHDSFASTADLLTARDPRLLVNTYLPLIFVAVQIPALAASLAGCAAEQYAKMFGSPDHPMALCMRRVAAMAPAEFTHSVMRVLDCHFDNVEAHLDPSGRFMCGMIAMRCVATIVYGVNGLVDFAECRRRLEGLLARYRRLPHWRPEVLDVLRAKAADAYDIKRRLDASRAAGVPRGSFDLAVLQLSTVVDDGLAPLLLECLSC